MKVRNSKKFQNEKIHIAEKPKKGFLSYKILNLLDIFDIGFFPKYRDFESRKIPSQKFLVENEAT